MRRYHFRRTTCSNSVYCGGTECRYAIKGSFSYQMISDMKCMFAVAYSNIDTTNLNLENSNIHNIELIRSAGIETNDQIYSGLIHVRYNDSHTQNNDIVITQI